MSREYSLAHLSMIAVPPARMADVAAGAGFDTHELSTDEHLRKRGTFVTVKHPVRGDFTLPGFPVKMSDSSVAVVCSPTLGQHTEKVLAELLSLKAEELQKLRAAGVETTADGVDWLLARPELPDLVFEATSAYVHVRNAPRYREAGIRAQ